MLASASWIVNVSMIVGFVTLAVFAWCDLGLVWLWPGVTSASEFWSSPEKGLYAKVLLEWGVSALLTCVASTTMNQFHFFKTFGSFFFYLFSFNSISAAVNGPDFWRFVMTLTMRLSWIPCLNIVRNPINNTHLQRTLDFQLWEPRCHWRQQVTTLHEIPSVRFLQFPLKIISFYLWSISEWIFVT